MQSMPIRVYSLRIHAKRNEGIKQGAIGMGKIQRARYIEKISSMLLVVYRAHEKGSPEMIAAQTEILTAFKTELQKIGLSRTSINDYLSCGLVRALDTYEKELKDK